METKEQLKEEREQLFKEYDKLHKIYMDADNQIKALYPKLEDISSDGKLGKLISIEEASPEYAHISQNRSYTACGYQAE